jgi:hypothetical protein
VVAEQLEPVCFVSALRRGQRQQNGAFFAGAVLRQVPVYGGFCPLVGQVLAPALDVCRVRGGAGVGLAGSVRFGVLGHGNSWAG